ncbi:hypothetical protein I4U23_029625 [Adineta vaga]|nr:hypothetical protein I4U23_029625 [Adineta vaga]
MVKNTNENRDRPYLKIIGLVWILIECSLVSGNIFGFASLFSVLPRYHIYEFRCKLLSEKIISNDTKTITKDCHAQIDEYQLAFALGIGFFNLPAVVIGVFGDFFGPRSLKLVGIVFHLISWISLALVAPGYDWLILLHTIFSSLAGMCVLLSSFAISANFTKTRGLVTSLISGAQNTGCICAMFFLDWRFACVDTSTKTKSTIDEVEISSSQDTLARHLTNPIFVVVTLFISCLLLTVSFLPVNLLLNYHQK